jgi:hypothetical protein
MPDLNFKVEAVDVAQYAASPQLLFSLQLSETSQPGESPTPINSVMLRCQIRLEPGRRRYPPAEQERLDELFGEPHRWGQTVRSTLWTNLMVSVPPFTGSTKVDLFVPCTFDFNVAGTKYFAALDDGDVPLSFLFSGTIFYAGEDGVLQIDQISWEKEAEFRLPVRVWKKMMEIYYPNTAWLCLRRDVFDRLEQFRRDGQFSTPEQAIETLLRCADPTLATEAVS